jgi:GMP synthase-like glutamine amidotransferase
VRALFVQHDPGSEPGLVGRQLAELGADVELFTVSDTLDDATFHGAFPAAADFDLVVSLGAIWSLYDRDTVGSWIDRELDLLRDADARGVPVLGICFGGQALAAAHGGTVSAANTPEIGWTTISSDDPDLVPPGPWMQWHTDRFTVPAAGTEVARNAVGPQAFRLRRNLGVQFHPEVTAAIVGNWLELGGDAALRLLATTGGSLDGLLADARANEERAAADVARLLDTYLAEVAGLG